MTTAEWLLCSRCNQAEDPGAAHCSHCGHSLLVDLVLTRALPNAKECHAAARRIAEIAPRRPFGELRSTLATRGRILLKRATRSEANAAKAVVELHGGEVVERPRSSSVARRPLVAGVCIAVLAIVGVVAARWPRPVLATRSIAALYCRFNQSSGDSTNNRLRVGTGTFVAGDVLLTSGTIGCERPEPLKVQMADGRILRGEEIRRDESLNVAVFRVAGADARPIDLGDAGLLELGTRVRVAIPDTDREPGSTTETALSHAIRQRFGIGFLQLDVKTDLAHTGAPVLDGRGRMVALITAPVPGYMGPDLALALPINYARFSEGGLPLLPASSDAQQPSPAWKRHLAAARFEEEREEQRWALEKPALLSATFWNGEFVGLFAKRDIGTARGLFDVVVRYDGQPKCQLPLRSERSWFPISDENAFRKLQKDVLSSELHLQFEWLQRRGLTTALWGISAEAPNVLAACGIPRSGAAVTMELVDGQPGFPAVGVSVSHELVPQVFLFR